VTEDLIAKRPEVVKRLVVANDRILAYMNEKKSDPKALAADLKSHYQIDEALLVASIDAAIKSIAVDSKLSRAAYEADLRVWTDSGIVKRAIPFAEAVDARFAGERP